MSVVAEFRPLWFLHSWQARKQLIAFLIATFLLPLLQTFVAITLASAVFVAEKDKVIVAPNYLELSLQNATSYQACNATVSPSCNCSLAIAPLASGSDPQHVALFSQWANLVDYALDVIPVLLFNSSQDISDNYALNPCLFAGLVLDLTHHPDYVTYEVRLPRTLLSAPLRYENPFIAIPPRNELTGGAKAFVDSGFTALQVLAEETIANLIASNNASSTAVIAPNGSGTPISNTSVAPTNALKLLVSASRGPHSAMQVTLLFIVPIIMIVVFLPRMTATAVEMTKERTFGLKAYWKVMGMTERAYWTMSIAQMLVRWIPSLVVLCVWTSVVGMWGMHSLMAVLNILGLTVSAVAFTMMVAVVAPSEGWADGLVSFWLFVSISPTKGLIAAPLPLKLIGSSVSTLNFSFAILEVLRLRALDMMGPSEVLPTSIALLGSYSFSASIFMYVFDTFLYITIAIVVSYLRVHPLNLYKRFMGAKPSNEVELGLLSETPESEFGSEPVGMELGQFRASSSMQLEEEEEDDQDREELPKTPRQPPPDPLTLRRPPEHFEKREFDPDTSIILSAKDVSMTADQEDKTSVSHFDLQLEDGSIYVLLGAPGSGKTSILSALSGVKPPSSGDIYIADMDTQLHPSQVSYITSYCPQQDILNLEMSPSDHLRLLHRLKCLPLEDSEQNITSLLAELGLTELADEPVKKLSVGERRSLMLAHALLVHSRLVIIDEASTGMNLDQRRRMWKAVLKRKNKLRTSFVISTVHVEDAEVMADLIGVMHKGSLVREGTVPFLTRTLETHITKTSETGHFVTSIPASQRGQVPAKLRELETTGHGHIKITSPSLERYIKELQAMLEAPESGPHSLSMPDSSGVEAGMSDWSDARYRNSPRDSKNRSDLRLFKEYFARRWKTMHRQKSNLLCFLVVPLILGFLAFYSFLTPGISMDDVPKAIAEYTATTQPLPISLADNLPLQIPYTSPNIDMPIIGPWNSTQLELYNTTSLTALSNFLWRTNGGQLAKEGGIALVSATFPSFRYNVAYNFSEVYSAVRLINFVNNAIVNYYLQQRNGWIITPNISAPLIRLRSVPFEARSSSIDLPASKPLIDALVEAYTGFGVLTPVVLGILAAVYAQTNVADLSSGLVAQLRRSGLRSSIYWTVVMIIGLLRFLVALFLLIAIASSIRVPFLRGASLLVYSVSLGIVTLCLMCLANLYSRRVAPENALPELADKFASQMVFVPMLAAQIVPAVFASVDWLVFVGKYMFYVIPPAYILPLAKQLALTYSQNNFQNVPLSTLLAMDNVGPYLVGLCSNLVVWFGLWLFLESRHRWVRQDTKAESAKKLAKIEPLPPVILSGGLPTTSVSASPSLQSDMEVEEDVPLSLEAMETTAAAIKTIHLGKLYPDMPRKVVDALTLTVSSGSSYALVGPRISGRSTVLGMIIGDETSSSGQIEINGHSTLGKVKNAMYQEANLGVCLQNNWLPPYLTVLEVVELFLVMRKDQREFDIELATYDILRRVNLYSDAETMVSDINVSAQRSLCVAIAALTFSDTLILDSPTHGCDLTSKFMLWRLIKEESLREGRSLLLSTSSIDEALKLCHTVGVMVNGKLVTEGTVSSLSAACRGYELKVWIRVTKENKKTAVADFEAQVLQEAFLNGFFQLDAQPCHTRTLCLHYDIPNVESPSAVFEVLGRALQTNQLIDFQFASLTLASAYHRLARQQLDDYSRHVDSSACKTKRKKDGTIERSFLCIDCK